jgi:hypothetical protein
VKNCEAMRKLIETAVVGINLGNAKVSQMHVQYHNIDSFPFFTAEMTFWISEPMTLGCDPFS